MRYVFFAQECYPYCLAKHLIDEGEEVIVATVVNKSELQLPDPYSESAESRRNRLSLYDGMLKKQSVAKVMDDLKKVKRSAQDDYFFFFDYIDMFKLGEKIMRMGFRVGHFPTEFYFNLEKNRIFAKYFVQECYPKVKVAEAHNFTKVKDGIRFINEVDDIFVLKSNGKFGRTIVPRTDKLDVARKVLIDGLNKQRQDYEKQGFLLEKKIVDGLEVTPVLVFWNGEPVYSLVELENKEIGSGNVGVQKGGNQVLSVRTSLDCKLNRIAFPKIVYATAREKPGLTIWDCGLLYDGKDFWYTEFCGNRYGWDGILSEMVMRDDGEPFVGNYFRDIMRGNNPLLNEFGVAVRLFSYIGEKEAKTECPFMYSKDIEPYLFLYNVKKVGDDVVSVGDYDFVAAVTGASDTVAGAVSKAYDLIDSTYFEKIYFRPKSDFLATDYKTSIPNRLRAIEPFIEEES